MSIPQHIADKLLADCCRRCCICRRFMPLHLHVHHIQHREEGGTDEPDNLIALCVTCHSSVHTKAYMTRNFTIEELKRHRDNTMAAVRDGRLVDNGGAPEFSGVTPKGLASTNFPASTQGAESREQLLPEAVEVLLAAVRNGGRLIEIKYDGGWVLRCVGDVCIPQGSAGRGQITQFGNSADHRKQALYRKAFEQLVKTGLIERADGNLFDVSHDGYLQADQLLAAEQLRLVQSGATS